MLKTILAKKIRNFLNFFPSFVLIDFRKKNISISDAFYWRTDKGFSTIFSYSNLLKIFYGDDKSKIEILFFDKFGKFLKKIDKEEILNLKKIYIDSQFMGNMRDYGTFYVFHNSNEKFNSIIRNSCYTAYSLNENLPSYVHGNICSASKDLNSKKINFNIIGKSFFKKNIFIVQNYIRSDKTEIILMNPTSKNLKIDVNGNIFKLINGEVRIIKIDKEIIKITSKCYFIRPIVFSYKNEYLDVYHG